MTTEAVQLQLEPRELLGRKVGRLRRAGIIPVHLYGPGIESRSLQCPAPQLVQALSLAGASTPITVKIEGEPGTHLAFAREIQWDPRRDTLVHVDLLAADVARLSVAQVNVVLFGESPGARISAGNVVQLTRTVEVQALPLEMPAQLGVDLGQLTEPDGLIRVGDIQLSPSVTVLTDAEEIVARIEIPRSGEFEAETPDGGPGAGAAAPGE